MRRPLLGLLLAVLTASLTASARAEEWSKTFSITAKPDLRVRTSDGNIIVDTWDQSTIEARVTTEGWKIGDRGVKVYERQIGDTVELEVKIPNEFCIVCVHLHRRAEIHIRMPREGRVNLHTGDGHIQLSNFKGEMQVESGDGSQDIASVDGVLHAHAGDGHIQADGRFDWLDVSTSDGKIGVSARPGSTLANNWNFKAGDGSVTLSVPGDFPADVDLHTGDGHITLEIPVAIDGQLKRNDIHGKMNGGGNLVTVHTGDGSITLQKS
jgi:DUF4097 and DUF4098 domain-containing protein YvlB